MKVFLTKWKGTKRFAYINKPGSQFEWIDDCFFNHNGVYVENPYIQSDKELAKVQIGEKETEDSEQIASIDFYLSSLEINKTPEQYVGTDVCVIILYFVDGTSQRLNALSCNQLYTESDACYDVDYNRVLEFYQAIWTNKKDTHGRPS